MTDEDVDKEQKVDIENNITLEPLVWIMKSFMAFFKAVRKQHGNVTDFKTELNLVFGVTKVKWLTSPLQNVLADDEVVYQPAMICMPHHSALLEEDVALHPKGNMQLVSYWFSI